MKEVQQFVRALFLSGQNELQSRDHESAEREVAAAEAAVSPGLENGKASQNLPNVINKFKLNVQTNAVCVDILVWATRDEFGKELKSNVLFIWHLNLVFQSTKRKGH